jgi:hypothetical protein
LWDEAKHFIACFGLTLLAPLTGLVSAAVCLSIPRRLVAEALPD